MINEVHIKNIATFKDAIISEMKKINIIYGSNGSGKTTISNIIQNPTAYNESEIKWTNDIPISTLVYNKTFRERNFGEAKIPGVFTLGENSKNEALFIDAKKRSLTEKREEKDKKVAEIKRLEENLTETENEFRDTVWKTIKQKYETSFRDAFVGYLNSRIKFANKIIDEFENNTRNSTSLNSLETRAQTLFSENPQTISPINIDFTPKITQIEQHSLWTKKIVGSDDIEIAPLIQQLNNSDWVNQGRKYIQANSNICPFCQKNTIDEELKEKIERYFSNSYATDVQNLELLHKSYIAYCNDIYSKLEEIINNEKEKETSKLDIQNLEKYLKVFNKTIIANNEIIKSKILEPSRSVTLENTEELTSEIKGIINQFNVIINNHNELVENSKIEKNILIEDIWRYIIDENKELITNFTRKKTGLLNSTNQKNKQIDELEKECKNINEEIIDANKRSTNIQSTIDNINKTLELYGFTNFSLVCTKDNFYQIKRANGELARNTLSEGEITFITFLYFMQLVKGGISPEDAANDRIVVIDDPISSLDSTILFVVSSLIKEELKKIRSNTGKIKQIIILTHNIYFHKEISFIDCRKKSCKDTFYWIVRKNLNRSSTQCYENMNPIRSSYEMLWDELKCKDSSSIITIQNTMRRIYETYFRILGKYNDDDILSRISDTREKEICRSLLSWVNDGSHCVPDDLHIIQHEDIIENYRNVFKKVFQLMGHIEHYNMMMGIDNEE